MEPRTQEVPGYYVWGVPGKPVAVHLHLDVLDRMSAEVMRGFGAVPKRGAEVGGVLIGTIEPGSPAIVRIEDFEPVACEYKRGPSYLFTDEEAPNFEAAVARWERNGARPTYAVGYYRSDTREGMRLGPEDIELLEACFPSASHVALLIKPYATKVSMAGFLVREEGVFPPESPLEFPFRRRELTGEAPPPRRSLYERRSRPRGGPAPAGEEESQGYGQQTPQQTFPQQSFPQPEPMFENEPAYVTTTPPKARKRTWVWIPLSFIFLLLGVLLGFQAALTMAPQLNAGKGASEFALDLAAERNGESVTVHWNRESTAVKNAMKGVLHLEDGGPPQDVTLTRSALQTGSVIYQTTSPAVQFRLEVQLNDRLTVNETLSWRQ